MQANRGGTVAKGESTYPALSSCWNLECLLLLWTGLPELMSKGHLNLQPACGILHLHEPVQGLVDRPVNSSFL